MLLTKPLGNVCEVRRGTVITQKTAVSGDVPVIAGGLEPAYFHNVANRPAETITVSGSGANAGYVNFHTMPIYASDCTTIFPKNSEDLDRKFLYLFMLSKQKFINDNLRCGAAQPHVYPKDLAKIEVPLLPMTEQRRIVAILDDAFAGIEAAINNTEKAITRAHEIFESTLSSIFAQQGGGWVEASLGQVVELYQGLAINKNTKRLLVNNSSLPLLRIKDLKSNEYELFVSEDNAPQSTKVNFKDIIFTRTGQVGLVFTGKYGVLHNNCFKVIPSSNVNNEFLFWFLHEKNFQKNIMKLASKAAQPDITHKLFKIQKIRFPSIESQLKIAREIDILKIRKEALVSMNTSKLSLLKELKQSLLNKAFSGKLTANQTEA